MRTLIGVSLLVFAVVLTACGKDGGGGGLSSYPGTEDGAKQLLTDIRKDLDTAKAMSKSLRPSSADYKAVFADDKAAMIEKNYNEMWNKEGDKAVIGAKPENTELKLWAASSDDIKSWTGNAKDHFPGGYEDIGAHLKPGITWYRWKYTKPGEDLGMAYDGLVHVNNHWVWFPKPWRALRE